MFGGGIVLSVVAFIVLSPFLLIGLAIVFNALGWLNAPDDSDDGRRN
jgi:hypothetical protein